MKGKFKYLIFHFSFFIFHFSIGQNLVPNFSFEDTVSCPISSGEIEKARFWFRANFSSPDYYNKCHPNSLSVPDNFIGTQFARTGSAYAGIVLAGDTAFYKNYREYIEIKLMSILKSENKYCISSYVSLANESQYASDALGILFSNDSVNAITSLPLPFIPQIINPMGFIINDTLNWTLISGVYTASGGEKFITIGNFLFDSSTNATKVSNGNQPFAYYYIDDVSVVPMSEADAGGDKEICRGKSVQLGMPGNPWIKYNWQPATGLSDASIAQPIASPLQTTTYYLTITDTSGYNCVGKTMDTVTVTVKNCGAGVSFFIPTIIKENELFEIKDLPEGTQLEVYNMLGQKIFVSENYKNTFGAYLVSNGMYVYRLILPTGEELLGKLCVLK